MRMFIFRYYYNRNNSLRYSYSFSIGFYFNVVVTLLNKRCHLFLIICTYFYNSLAKIIVVPFFFFLVFLCLIFMQKHYSVERNLNSNNVLEKKRDEDLLLPCTWYHLHLAFFRNSSLFILLFLRNNERVCRSYTSFSSIIHSVAQQLCSSVGTFSFLHFFYVIFLFFFCQVFFFCFWRDVRRITENIECVKFLTKHFCYFIITKKKTNPRMLYRNFNIKFQ